MGNFKAVLEGGWSILADGSGIWWGGVSVEVVD